MKTLTLNRFLLLLGISLLLSLLSLLLFPLVGPVSLDLNAALFEPGSRDHTILMQTRLPRVLFAALAGGALSVSGVVFQAILRNPLASPFTLGISSGAALGAVIAILFGWHTTYWGFSPLPLASFAGAITIVVLVYMLAQAAHHFSPMTLLLAGVVLNYLCGSIILLIHLYSDFTKSFLMMRWMMGGLDVFEYSAITSVGPFVLLGLGVVLYGGKYLNVLSAGEEWAAARGLNVRRLLTLNYFGASLLTGSVVAFSGPIGFVGLIIPHVLRMILGADHRVLLPVSFLLGGVFLLICDSLARTLLAPGEIPVGILTSLLGGPFFLWLLIRKRGKFFF